MRSVSSRTLVHSCISIVCILICIANIYAARTFDAFGSPFLFATSVLFEVVVAAAALYAAIVACRIPLRIMCSIMLSAGKGIAADPYMKQFRKTHPKLYRWISDRFDPKQPAGLLLTTGLAISLVFLYDYLVVLQDVLFHTSLTMIDSRVINLMPSIRTPLQTAIFRTVSTAGELPLVCTFALLILIIVWREKKWFMGLLVGGALISDAVSETILKQLVHRARPLPALSLVREDSFSFPSGHTLYASLAFGILAYFLWRTFHSTLARAGIVSGYLVSLLLIAASRVYLGAHYPSDVLASVLYGSCLLTLCITISEIVIRYSLFNVTANDAMSKTLAVVPIGIIVVSILASPYVITLHPIIPVRKPVMISSVNADTIHTLPLYSETLTGKPMEPIDFVYIGSQQQIVALFKHSGWYVADPSTIANTLKALSIGFQNRQYINAPVTPSYLEAKPENIAFERPTDAATLRQRHHTRLWLTNDETPDGTAIWVASASYDEGIEFAGAAHLPTHHIDPNIDAERTYILQSLHRTHAPLIQAVGAQAGQNASGDIFFTDGRVAVVQL